MRRIKPIIHSQSSASPAMKLLDHVVTTSKTVHERSSVTSGEIPTRFRRKVVRIILTDADATDSSSEDEEEVVVRRVKRHVNEINFKPSPKYQRTKKRSLRSPEADPARRKKFRGVRQRPWGRWAAEIRDSTLRKRVWLGTYDTPEEAAQVYDMAAVRLKGPDAVTNFPRIATTEPVVESQMKVEGLHKGTASSPTSVLRYDEFTPFDSLGYGDVDFFGFESFDMDMPLSLTDIVMTKKYYGEEEDFGEFNIDDFLVEVRS